MVALPFIVKAAGIVVDGGTVTSISTAANGGQAVNIAPAISGVSQNTYSSFNVSTAGATLNNVGINARTRNAVRKETVLPAEKGRDAAFDW
jgi:hypothetical protein